MAFKGNVLHSEKIPNFYKKQSLIYNPTCRATIFQVIAILVLMFVVHTIVKNVLTNVDIR